MIHFCQVFKFSIVIIIFFLNTFGYTQEDFSIVQDSLKDKSYEYLINQIRNYQFKDNKKTNIYCWAYLDRAKEDTDSLKIAEAYYYLSYYNKDHEKSLRYIDRVPYFMLLPKRLLML